MTTASRVASISAICSMKLYATVTSERASKGQGGNDFLEIELTGEGGQFIASVHLFPHATGDMSKHLLHVRDKSQGLLFGAVIDKEKGKRQKGDSICDCSDMPVNHTHINGTVYRA